MAAYHVLLCDPYGEALADLNDYSSLEYARAVNSVGALTLSLPGHYDLSLFRIDGRIAVYRQVAGAWSLDTETIWFVRRVTYSLLPSGAYQVKLLAYDASSLLARRIVAYDASTAQADQAGPADNIMKTVVRENLGDLATDTARDLSAYLSVAPYLDLAPDLVAQIAYKPVLAVLQEIARASEEKGTFLAFDIAAPTLTSLQFRTYTGQRGKDRRYPGQTYYPIGPQYGNLVNIERVDDHTDSASFVYCASQYENQDLETAQDDSLVDSSPFGRIEIFRRAANTSDTDALEDEALAALVAVRPRKVFSAQLSSEDYGETWAWGDRLTVDFAGEALDCRLNAIKVSVGSDGAERVEAKLRIE